MSSSHQTSIFPYHALFPRIPTRSLCFPHVQPFQAPQQNILRIGASPQMLGNKDLLFSDSGCKAHIWSRIVRMGLRRAHCTYQADRKRWVEGKG